MRVLRSRRIYATEKLQKRMSVPGHQPLTLKRRLTESNGGPARLTDPLPETISSHSS
jgi:hypothetical protein